MSDREQGSGKAEKRQLDPSNIRINVYEKQYIFGPGFPHSDRFALPFLITNMCAADMEVLDGKSGDSQDWVTTNSVPDPNLQR
jgi:hypothetical protein